MKLEIPDEYFNEEELINTPNRWKRFIQEWTDNNVSLTTFPNPGYDQMITWIGKDYSMCSHHCLPFILEKVLVAYIPDKKIVGLSKIPRVISMFSHKPQIQERLTQQIADYLFEKLECHGVLVAIKGRHLCCEMRGQKSKGVMVTTSLKGVFSISDSAKNEALKLFY